MIGDHLEGRVYLDIEAHVVVGVFALALEQKNFSSEAGSVTSAKAMVGMESVVALLSRFVSRAFFTASSL